MSRLNDLSSRTESILEALNAAQDAIGGAGRHCNGWGILHDVGNTRGRIADAIARLSRAQQIIDTTSWPTNSEYEAFELEHNRR